MTRRINGDALENRSGAAATGNVFTFDDAHVDGGVWQAPGAGSAWPVGSIFLSAVLTNPATLLGFGTWSAIGAGRVLIGIDSGDVDFDTLGETGGSKTSAHAHGAGTLATSGGSWHSHGAGTLAPSAHSGGAVDAHSGTAVTAHANHTHVSGTLATSAHATHRHQMISIVLHAHSIAAGQGSHQHGMAEGQTDGAGTYMDRSNAASATTAQTDLATLPAMATDYQGVDPAYSENTVVDAHTMSGSTGNESASLTHSVTQPSAHVFTQPSAHTMSGTTADEGAHTHSVDGGATASAAPSIVQPYLVVAMWQRTA